MHHACVHYHSIMSSCTVPLSLIPMVDWGSGQFGDQVKIGHSAALAYDRGFLSRTHTRYTQQPPAGCTQQPPAAEVSDSDPVACTACLKSGPVHWEPSLMWTSNNMIQGTTSRLINTHIAHRKELLEDKQKVCRTRAAYASVLNPLHLVSQFAFLCV